jgi:hypothetical protein
MNQKQRTIGFFSCIAALVIFGTCLIVSSCKNDAPATQPQARLTPGAYQQYDQLSPQQQQAPTVVYEQAPPQEDHFWRDMYIWNAMFGSRQTVVVQQPAYRPVYHPLPMQYPAPVVNKTVQNDQPAGEPCSSICSCGGSSSSCEAGRCIHTELCAVSATCAERSGKEQLVG